MHKKNLGKSGHFVLENAKVIGISIVAAFLVCMIFIFALGDNPVYVFWTMLKGALGRKYGLAEILAKATPLIIIGLGITVAAKGGMSNLGGDGQFYVGALASITVGLFLPPSWPSFLVWILAFLAAVISGGIWGALAGWLKSRFNTSEVIITIMLNYVALYFVGFMVSGPLQAPGGIPQTKSLDAARHFPKIISGTRAHGGIILAIIGAFMVWYLFKKMKLGYRIQTVGESPKAATYGGINTKGYMVLTMFIAGAFAGVAGMAEVYGVYYRVLEGITVNLGFTALLIALLARLNPFAVILGSLFISALTVGANSMQIVMNVPTSIVDVVQSLIIFFMLIMPAILGGLNKRFLKDRRGVNL